MQRVHLFKNPCLLLFTSRFKAVRLFKKHPNMRTLANISRAAMWVMIGALVLSFFQRGRWITVLWVSAAVVCVVCLLLISFRGRGR